MEGAEKWFALQHHDAVTDTIDSIILGEEEGRGSLKVEQRIVRRSGGLRTGRPYITEIMALRLGCA